MEDEKKVVIFIHDGIVEGGFTSDPSINVVVCDFNRDMDDADAENDYWDQCKNEGLKQFSPDIYHPCREEE